MSTYLVDRNLPGITLDQLTAALRAAIETRPDARKVISWAVGGCTALAGAALVEAIAPRGVAAEVDTVQATHAGVGSTHSPRTAIGIS